MKKHCMSGYLICFLLLASFLVMGQTVVPSLATNLGKSIPPDNLDAKQGAWDRPEVFNTQGSNQTWPINSPTLFKEAAATTPIPQAASDVNGVLKGKAANARQRIVAPETKGDRQTRDVPVFLVVDTHLKKDPTLKNVNRFIKQLERIYPANYESIHWRDYASKVVEAKKYSLVIFSPQGTPWPKYPAEGFNRLLREVRHSNLPLLGICGGHQLIILAFGGTVGPIEPQNSVCDYPDSYNRCNREKGYTSVFPAGDPVFKDFKDQFRVWENHVEEVKTLPPDFTAIASSKICGIQAVRNQKGRIYGFQFHPELSNSDYGDGKKIIDRTMNLLLGFEANGLAKDDPVRK